MAGIRERERVCRSSPQEGLLGVGWGTSRREKEKKENVKNPAFKKEKKIQALRYALNWMPSPQAYFKRLIHLKLAAEEGEAGDPGAGESQQAGALRVLSFSDPESPWILLWGAPRVFKAKIFESSPIR